MTEAHGGVGTTYPKDRVGMTHDIAKRLDISGCGSGHWGPLANLAYLIFFSHHLNEK